MKNKLVIGVDYGSDSVRVVIVDSINGEKIASGVCNYPRWAQLKYCDPTMTQYRQHALDYIEALKIAMKSALSQLEEGAGMNVIGLAVDTTGSTPCPVDRNGTPLCLLKKFEDNPNAMFHLWKDHTAVEEAKEINELFSNSDIDYTKFQGIYSSEWYWAKILHTVKADEDIRNAAYSWVEHSDWLAGLLVGNTDPKTMHRGACPAGHKALWHSEFNGLPPVELLNRLDPHLGDVAKRYANQTTNAGTRLGNISKEWAQELGLNPQLYVGMGSFDAHAGGVGAGIEKNTMIEVVGTSTVAMLIDLPETLKGKDLKEVCGQAENSIVPGYVGIEMSQPAFGDVYAWFKELLEWPIRQFLPSEILSDEKRKELLDHIKKNMIRELELGAKDYLKDELVALDWFNGRRYPVLNENVRAAIAGLSLGTKPEQLFCALAKGTVFGCKRIYNSLIDNGMQIDRIIAVGGIAKKSEFVMQLMTDCLNVPIMVCEEEQVCAKGASIFATVAAGSYESIELAQKAFCQPYKANYFPNPENVDMFNQQYDRYLRLGDFVEFKLG